MPYDHFELISGVEVDGFRLGQVTDFMDEPDTAGDAFVEAPDGSRAGLSWETGVEEPFFAEAIAPDNFSWGVWAVGTGQPDVLARSDEDVRLFLREVVPHLRPIWQEWAARVE